VEWGGKEAGGERETVVDGMEYSEVNYTAWIQALHFIHDMMPLPFVSSTARRSLQMSDTTVEFYKE
jgi:hypothetical protein